MYRRPALVLTTLIGLFFLSAAESAAQEEAEVVRQRIIGDALMHEGAYRALETMTTRFGHRMIGTPGSERSMVWLEQQLGAMGIATRREPLSFPGWIRGADRVSLVSPVARELRAVAMGYVGPHGPFEARVVYLEDGDLGNVQPTELRGAVALLAPNLTFSSAEQQVLSERWGVRGLLMINRVNGGQVLARTGSRTGTPTPFPVMSITVEEGQWMRRALEDGQPVRVRIETTSRPVEMTVDNLVATIPGTSGKKVVVGAHFDSWDLGQGAMDNGLGVAQLYETARLIRRNSQENRHTVELVWFNAEELGLYGSHAYVQQHDLDSVLVMLNLDMVGRPDGLNAMGFDELLPVLEAYQDRLGAWSFGQRLSNKTWLGSDHHPFVLNGVPAITFYAPIDQESVRYYHDFADTFDKIDREMLGRASALIALLTYELANVPASSLRRYDGAETAELLRQAGLEEQLRAAGEWPDSR